MVNRWNPKLGIVSSMAHISGGQELADLLNRSEYVAIRNGEGSQLIDKCQIEVVRGEGYGLKEFGYNKGFGTQRESISESEYYLFVGPTNDFDFTTPLKELIIQLKALLYTEMQTN